MVQRTSIGTVTINYGNIYRRLGKGEIKMMPWTNNRYQTWETSELFKRMNIARSNGKTKWIEMNRELNRRGWIKKSDDSWELRKRK